MHRLDASHSTPWSDRPVPQSAAWRSPLAPGPPPPADDWSGAAIYHWPQRTGRRNQPYSRVRQVRNRANQTGDFGVKRIVILIPYFGRWPDWFPLYLESCRANPSVDSIFFTDCAVPDNPPPQSEVPLQKLCRLLPAGIRQTGDRFLANPRLQALRHPTCTGRYPPARNRGLRLLRLR